MSKLIGQHLFTGIQGLSLSDSEKKFIVDNNIGGVVLFARNVAEPKQVRDLCAEIQSLRHRQSDRAPIFIGIDMEGGRVHRLKAPFTVWPPLARLGQIDNPTVSFHFSHRLGQELRAVGINLDFAPDLDVFTNPKNTVIGDRAISSDAAVVERHASALVRGLIKADVLACAKHYPGHGNTLLDSHLELPVEDLDREALEKRELVPFKKAFRSRVDMVMAAHILFPKIDAKWPATLSEIFLKDMLRKDFRYRGLVITDDLGMGALVKHFSREEIAVRALEAGVDLLLYCNEFDAPPAAIEPITKAIESGRLKKTDLEASKARILEVKKDRLAQPDPPTHNEMIKIVGSAENLRIAAAIAKGETPDGLMPE